MDRRFLVTLHHGEGNARRTVDIHSGLIRPRDAAEIFMSLWFPGEQVYPLREEQPEEIAGRLFKVWSAGTGNAGLRLWVREQIGGFDQPRYTLGDFNGGLRAPGD